MAYQKQAEPKIAVEVLIGHGVCHVIIESSCDFTEEEIAPIINRIAGENRLDLCCVRQDIHLARNQDGAVRCGDNGIFRGAPLTEEQKELSRYAHEIYEKHPHDGKYILDGRRMIICQSNVSTEQLHDEYPSAEVNPLGDWTGGTDVDTGATNRKLGSDMADGVTGGGLHGKDLSKADVSVNIYAFLKAQELQRPVELCCAIGDTEIDGIPYSKIVDTARDYIKSIGGCEKFAEWGLY